MKKIIEVTKDKKLPDGIRCIGYLAKDKIINPDEAPIFQKKETEIIFFYEMDETDYKTYCKLNKIKNG